MTNNTKSRSKRRQGQAQGQGQGVDVFGGLDPTENVKALTEAANKRQDDLRVGNNELIQAQLSGLQDIITQHVKCIKELNAAEARRLDEQAALRSDYTERLSSAEAKRIDAIRAVDVNAVAVASQRASDQATVLATQVAQSAEALRGLVASTAATNQQAQQTANAQLSQRITTLEQAQYKGEGKGVGIGASWAVFLAVATLIVASIVGFFVVNRSPITPPPQVIYAPSPLTPPQNR